MKRISDTKKHGAIGLGLKHGGIEYTQQSGMHSGRSCAPSKGKGAGSAMIDGPFGGKKPVG